jgi:hypothetical protein
MRNVYFIAPGIGLVAALAISSVLCAQTPERPAAANLPAAASQLPDLSGVWRERAPASARAYSGFAFTKGEPPMTPWAEA